MEHGLTYRRAAYHTLVNNVSNLYRATRRLHLGKP
jgi:hypothetical protein